MSGQEDGDTGLSVSEEAVEITRLRVNKVGNTRIESLYRDKTNSGKKTRRRESDPDFGSFKPNKDPLRHRHKTAF